MLQETSISERRACALVGLSRDSWRHPPQRAQSDHGMSERIKQLAHERRPDEPRAAGDKDPHAVQSSNCPNGLPS